MTEPLKDLETNARRRDLEIAEKKAEKARDEARKNNDFTQVYPKYWRKIAEIIDDNPRAAMLYNFLAENCAPDTGALVVSQQVLADKLGVSRMTISRYVKYLEERSVLLKISLSGGVCAYALDPEMVWKSYSTNKDYATFKTKTLVKKIDLEKNEIHRKLNVMLKEQKKQEEVDGSQIDLEDYIEKMETLEKENDNDQL